jgi:membrane fusion protein, multidrug efflux system
MEPDKDAAGAAGSHGHEGDFDVTAYRPSSRRLMFATTLGGLLLLALLAVGVIPRLASKAAAREDQTRADSELARVLVVKPARQAIGNGVTLPGSIQPVQETVVYPRTNGYIRKYFVDLGDKVKGGQALAEIDTPEVDQELRQAQASANQARALVSQAKTQLELARTENVRYATLRPSGVVSQQESEEHQAQFDAQEANVAAARAALGSSEANVHRLQDLKSFATVTAPFDGVVTSRTTEVGQLVTAGMATGQSIFKVAKTDVMRVFVNVPQFYAPSVRVGDEAPILVREFPERSFKGSITRTANELDMATRTLLTEVRVANDENVLIAGMFAQVTVPLKRAGMLLAVPSTALLVDVDGTRMAVVENGVIHWRQVEVDGDTRGQVTISSGLRDSDMVVITPSDRLTEGLKVRAEEPSKP